MVVLVCQYLFVFVMVGDECSCLSLGDLRPLVDCVTDCFIGWIQDFIIVYYESISPSPILFVPFQLWWLTPRLTGPLWDLTLTRRVTPTLINPFLYLNDYDFEDVCFRCLTEVEFRSPSYPFVDVLESGFTVCPRGSHDLGVTIGIPRGLPG